MKKIIIILCFTLFAISAWAEIDPELLKKAEAGDAQAQCNLGIVYATGEGVPQDFKKAFEWFDKSAKQGYAEAQFALGNMYDFGEGVAQDYKKAFEWYVKAANQGYAKAQYNIGQMYYNGDGVAQDEKKAFEWYTKAANRGHVRAQYLLSNKALNSLSKDLVTGCAWAYIAKDISFSNYCDNQLNQAQMTRTLHLMDELKKGIVVK